MVFIYLFSRQAQCHHYHGHICNNYLDKSKPLYINRSPKILEEKLRSPFSLLKSRLLVTCEKYALKAICLTTYPYCANSSEPKPVQLCKEDCEELESNVCESDFRVARQFDYFNSILPNCSVLPLKNSKEGEGCVTLELPGNKVILFFKIIFTDIKCPTCRIVFELLVIKKVYGRGKIWGW